MNTVAQNQKPFEHDPTVILALPALDVLHDGLQDAVDGHVANRVPIDHGMLQVGFRGTPEGFGVLDVKRDGNGIAITNESTLALEGPYVDTTTGTKRVGRTAIRPFTRLTVMPTETRGEWALTVVDANGDAVGVDSQERVVMARTVAKLADVSLGKLGRSKPTAA